MLAPSNRGLPGRLATVPAARAMPTTTGSTASRWLGLGAIVTCICPRGAEETYSGKKITIDRTKRAAVYLVGKRVFVAGAESGVKRCLDLKNPKSGPHDDSIKKLSDKQYQVVGSIEAASESVGLSEFFIGVIVVAIVGNAAEHWVAVLVAIKDKMDLSVNIAIGSSAQIALFVAPVLVIAAALGLGPGPLPLVFNGFEIAAVFLAVLVAYQVNNEGESNWFEGVQLLALYIILGLTFFYA